MAGVPPRGGMAKTWNVYVVPFGSPVWGTGPVCDVVCTPAGTELMRYTATESPGARVGAVQPKVAVRSPAVAVTLVGDGVTDGVDEPEFAVELCPPPAGLEPIGGLVELCELPA